MFIRPPGNGPPLQPNRPRVNEFGNKPIREHSEDITGFLKNKKMENLKEIERKAVK